MFFFPSLAGMVGVNMLTASTLCEITRYQARIGEDNCETGNITSVLAYNGILHPINY